MLIIDKYAEKINGVLSTFDRMIIKGHILQFFSDSGKKYFLRNENVRYMDFSAYAKNITEEIDKHIKLIAEQSGRPYQYLNSPKISKEGTALEYLKENPVETGLICVLSTVELCKTLQPIKNQSTGKLELRNVDRKCKYYYLYFLDDEFGFMHIKIQAWFPFTVQIYINGREYLSKKLDKEGIKYNRYDNSFTYIENIEKAQELADEIESVKLCARFDAMANRINPFLNRIKEIFGVGYYWCMDQCEYATDIMFKRREDLEEIYPALVEYAITTFSCEDVMVFMGRKMHGSFKGEVVSNTKKRSQGIRIKHSMKSNSVKMYDKNSVLRIETTINAPKEFKIQKEVEGENGNTLKWVPMGKSIANLYRYARVSLAINKRYADAIVGAVPTKKIVEQVEKVTQPTKKGKRSYSGFNVFEPEVTRLFSAVLHGNFTINGFNNKDLRRILFPGSIDDIKTRNKVTRLIGKLRAHGLIRKAPKSFKYYVSSKGRNIMAGIIFLKQKDYALFVLRSDAV